MGRVSIIIAELNGSLLTIRPKGVLVSLIGRDRPCEIPVEADVSPGKKGPPRIWIADVAREVEKEISGKVLSDEEIEQKKVEVRQQASAVVACSSEIKSSFV